MPRTMPEAPFVAIQSPITNGRITRIRIPEMKFPTRLCAARATARPLMPPKVSTVFASRPKSRNHCNAVKITTAAVKARSRIAVIPECLFRLLQYISRRFCLSCGLKSLGGRFTDRTYAPRQEVTTAMRKFRECLATISSISLAMRMPSPLGSRNRRCRGNASVKLLGNAMANIFTERNKSTALTAQGHGSFAQCMRCLSVHDFVLAWIHPRRSVTSRTKRLARSITRGTRPSAAYTMVSIDGECMALSRSLCDLKTQRYPTTQHTTFLPKRSGRCLG
mmetsp:Transcript_12627/g.34880  ORF Transcript_12627/g.34880 Transcript_12627/m.34880 type:complete len:278 (-) Transcript_12627:68-901(-)